ncbi:protein RDM16 [Punica granatum]|uniref:Protein RDM16 n=3 Tax=Punica granatum TaxID=22663 RepID=A0A218WBE1_PUNGR|nr:protein RDM16 [Punica granatum]OWM70115.1 hypothetical protein CDL15_Pgr025965 [Punica granatum]
MEKSSSSKRSREDRDREYHKHRDSEHHRKSSSHRDHRSKREDRASSRDPERSYDSRNDDRERSREQRDDRDGGRDERARYRERSYDGREESVERKHKRKERERVEDEGADGEEKRARVSDGERKQRRRFEDVNGDQEERRETRRFGDKAKEGDSERAEVKSKDEVTGNGGVAAVNGAALASSTMKSSIDTTVTSSHPLPTKVSSISTTNENKGVSITRSHEVPGKTSTDGTSPAAGKSGSLSLDVLAKAKKALQIQKELSEKLKKIPLPKKGVSSSSDGTLQAVSSTSTQPGASGVASASSTLPAGATPFVMPSSGGNVTASGMTTLPNYEAVKRAQELAAKMGFRQDPQFAPLINLFPGQVTTEVAMPQKPTKAPVLRLDALGREIDEHGNVVNITKPSNLSTLKVNINKQKKDAFQILKPELDVDPESNPHFDARMGINKDKLLRPKRMSFQFVEEGKWSKEAEMLKLKSQFGEARAKEQKAKQAQLAKAKAAPDINPNLIEVSERVIIKEKPKDEIPEVEWWDRPLLHSGTYGEVNDGAIDEGKVKIEKINIYVEHPRPIEPPAEPAPPPPQPLKLTKKEQKKLRTQRRVAKEKDKQEMIRQGLVEPPKPKVKMSNLMKVLGAEATQDPTKLEREIRTAAAEREQAHVDRNIARKLTPAERREKKERKLFDDPNTMETIVSVYKTNDLSHKKTQYLVDVNAKENRLTGCAVISEGINVVVAEGGKKSIKRYGNLMLRRIDWAAAVNDDEDEEEDEEDKPMNKCVLVWQGSVAKPSFTRFSIHHCMTEAAARKVFADAGVGHYWDLAVNFAED